MSWVAIGTTVVSIGTSVYGKDQASIAAKNAANQQLKMAQLAAQEQAERTKQMQLAASQQATGDILNAAEIEKKKEKTKRTIIIIGSVIVGLAITTVSVLLVFKKNKNKTSIEN